ncbi:MAG: hypothetical protein GC208_10450 [Alphaproteobacteria bacterium]|nr:hypothetical protein [Alphaproteobacteria bacterium]
MKGFVELTPSFTPGETIRIRIESITGIQSNNEQPGAIVYFMGCGSHGMPVVQSPAQIARLMDGAPGTPPVGTTESSTDESNRRFLFLDDTPAVGFPGVRFGALLDKAHDSEQTREFINRALEIARTGQVSREASVTSSAELGLRQAIQRLLDTVAAHVESTGQIKESDEILGVHYLPAVAKAHAAVLAAQARVQQEAGA